MKIKSTFLVFLALFLSAGADNTFAIGHRIDKRELKQEKRIEKGIASGQLNAQESARLLQGQSNIAAMEATAKADGKMTKVERRQINQSQNKESRAIRRMRHNRR